MSAADFNWHGENEEIVVPQQDAIAVYRNDSGDVVIRQRGWAYDDDVWIIVTPGSAKAIAGAILREIGAADDRDAPPLPLNEAFSAVVAEARP